MNLQSTHRKGSNILFETESHLVWIESVIDLLHRRKELKNRLSTLTGYLKDGSNQEAQYDYVNEKMT